MGFYLKYKLLVDIFESKYHFSLLSIESATSNQLHYIISCFLCTQVISSFKRPQFKSDLTKFFLAAIKRCRVVVSNNIVVASSLLPTSLSFYACRNCPLPGIPKFSPKIVLMQKRLKDYHVNFLKTYIFPTYQVSFSLRTKLLQPSYIDHRTLL